MSKKSLILVIIQFSCFAYYLFSGRFLAHNFWIPIQVAGFVISIWGILSMKLGNFNIQPEVKPTAHFVSNGPYQYIRNPMYSGLILFFAAAVFSNYSILHLVVLFVLTVVFIEKIKMEEKFLSDKFGNQYIKYLKTTFRLIPMVY